MSRSLSVWYEQIDIAGLLGEYPGLRVVPSDSDSVDFHGMIPFQGPGQSGEVIADTYDIAMWVFPSFPKVAPLVRETGGRIPPDFHKLEGDFLCLGAPAALRLRLQESPTLPAFLQHFVVPYLYGHSYYNRFGTMPFGELAHGAEGLCEYFCELFGVEDGNQALAFLRVASLQKGAANKEPCPCGGGKRLGVCHNRRVNELRRRFGRSVFREEYERLTRRKVR